MGDDQFGRPEGANPFEIFEYGGRGFIREVEERLALVDILTIFDKDGLDDAIDGGGNIALPFCGNELAAGINGAVNLVEEAVNDGKARKTN